MVRKLRDAKAQEQEVLLNDTETLEEMHSADRSLCGTIGIMASNKRMLGNLIAVLIVWSVSGFSYYLLDFYVKYFPGSVFLNKALFGVVDALGLFYIQFVQRFFKKVSSVIRLSMAGTVLLCLLYYGLTPLTPVLVPVIIALIRMQVNSMQSYGYHIN